MSEATAKLYFEMLRDIEPTLLSAAVAKCIAELKWMPKISEIRSAAADIAGGSVQEMSAMEAWGFAQWAISRIDFEIPHTLTNAQKGAPPLVWEAMRNAGLSNLMFGQVSWTQKSFIDSYNSIAARERKTLIMLPDVKREIEARRNSGSQSLGFAADITGQIGLEATND